MRVSSNLTAGTKVERSHPPPPPFRGGGVGVAVPAKPDRSEAAEWVRANLPICSAFAAELKSFFTEARLTYANEAGHSIGKPSPAPALSISGDALMESLLRKAKGKR